VNFHRKQKKSLFWKFPFHRKGQSD